MSLCTAFTSRLTLRAASRMDTGPAPHRTFESSQRFAVRTFHRSSGDAKLMREVFCGLPVRHAPAKAAMDTLGSRTSRVTVFTVPPRYVALDGCKERLGRGEGVLRFNVSEVTAVSLAELVVVANDAHPIEDVRQAVLELSRGPGYRRGQLPQHRLSEGVLGVDDSGFRDEGRFHVGDVNGCRKAREKGGAKKAGMKIAVP